MLRFFIFIFCLKHIQVSLTHSSQFEPYIEELYVKNLLNLWEIIFVVISNMSLKG